MNVTGWTPYVQSAQSDSYITMNVGGIMVTRGNMVIMGWII